MTLEKFTDCSNIDTINNKYTEAIRQVRQRVTVGYWSYSNSGRTFTSSHEISSGIKNIKITTDGGKFPLGVALCATLTFQFFNTQKFAERALNNCILKVEAGIYDRETDDYIYTNLGYFRPDSVISDDNWKSITVTAYDDIYLLSNKKITPTSSTASLYDLFKPFWGSIAECFYVPLCNYLLTPTQQKSLQNYTARDVLGYAAAANGGFFKLTRNDNLLFCKITDNPTVYNNTIIEKVDFKQEEKRFTISGVKAGLEDDFALSGTDANPCCVDCPLSTSASDSIAIALHDTITDSLPADAYYTEATYTTGTLTTRGNPILEVGEIINFYDGYRVKQRIVASSVSYDVIAGKMQITSIIPESELSAGSAPATKEYVDSKIDKEKDTIKSEVKDDVVDAVEETIKESVVTDFPLIIPFNLENTSFNLAGDLFANNHPLGTYSRDTFTNLTGSDALLTLDPFSFLDTQRKTIEAKASHTGAYRLTDGSQPYFEIWSYAILETGKDYIFRVNGFPYNKTDNSILTTPYAVEFFMSRIVDDSEYRIYAPLALINNSRSNPIYPATYGGIVTFTSTERTALGESSSSVTKLGVRVGIRIVGSFEAGGTPLAYSGGYKYGSYPGYELDVDNIGFAVFNDAVITECLEDIDYIHTTSNWGLRSFCYFPSEYYHHPISMQNESGSPVYYGSFCSANINDRNSTSTYSKLTPRGLVLRGVAGTEKYECILTADKLKKLLALLE